MSNCFFGVPSGLDLSQIISPLYPMILDIFFASSLIEISLPVPTFKKYSGLLFLSFGDYESDGLQFSKQKIIASARS